MKLVKIKLSGFKSFVDPTTVHLPSNIIGIVGPNGCGKSNIIDAVRWVMGESSAKHLRGESMADVIFNGSNSRKPVGQASIELIFDNSSGGLVGQYAGFNEISIKRQVSRDGTSTYLINGAKCRKRDIVDVFLGTGLGPRSYSIIEQGMISRLIEAKPEELRVFLEEAAGISKYKERRRETENRIKHTRENLDRLNDLRDEVDKQIRRLQRQARTAEKYKELKKEERKLQAELLLLRLQDLDTEIRTEQQRVSQQETALQEEIARQRAIEATLEQEREDNHQATDVFNEVQGRYYGIGGEIAGKEQAIQHARDMRRKHETDLEEARQNFAALQSHIHSDEEKIRQLESALERHEPALEQARRQAEESRQALQAAEQKMHDWQQEWDQYNQRAAAPSETAQVEKTRIEQLEKQSVQYQQRLSRLEQEQAVIQQRLRDCESESLEQELSETERRKSDLQARLDANQDEIAQKKSVISDLQIELDESREQYQTQRERLLSLEAVQKVALGDGEAHSDWITQCGLQDAPKLLDAIDVEAGWERAVETVLGQHIDAVCVEDIDSVSGLLHSLDKGAVSLFQTDGQAAQTADPQRLLSKVSAPWSLESLLADVFVAEHLNDAISLRARLKDNESVITRSGIWIGRNWLRVAAGGDEEGGVIERRQQIESLRSELALLTENGQALKERFEHQQELLLDLETERDSLQEDYNTAHQRYAELSARLEAQQQNRRSFEKRLQEMEAESAELGAQLEQNQQETREARQKLEQALADMENFAGQRETLLRQREELQHTLGELKERARRDSEQAHQAELEVGACRSELKSTRENLQRMSQQVQTLRERKEELERELHDSELPIHAMEKELHELLEQRVKVEAELNEARRKLDDIDNAMRQHELDRSAVEKRIEEVRGRLETLKMAWQEVRVRRQTVQEQFQETGFDRDELVAGIPEDASAQEWQDRVEQTEKRISRLGPINLAAIEEYTAEVERKQYLDSQFDDVTSALETLENAIRKIDRETKAKFKETFDKVNEGLNRMFPRLFGGGHAYLELTEDDLLNAGVTIMARPPGKRNSTIHLLSGGEKALTAVAMVFSIFLLNPSPFCMLDEVDAPLDDANVGRFCELVKEMSSQVQFIIITHNKVTMAIANQLSGVTMQEPGVSRMVAVDVDEAVKLAAV